jgi:uncharacterized protein YndB with AHSA1/START domain
MSTEHATLEQGDDRSTLRFERHLQHDVERVWRAVTEPDELAAWFPAAVIYEPAVGAPMQFDFGGMHGQDVWPGEVLEWDPPRAFAFRWGTDDLRFVLEPDGESTILVFTHTFRHEPGKPARDAAGWESCLDELLKHLSGGETVGRGGTTWAEHHVDYLARFGDLTVGDRRVRLQGPPREVDGGTGIDVTIGDADEPGLLVVADELRDGAPVELRAGSVNAPGDVVASGTLHDPLARG